MCSALVLMAACNDSSEPLPEAEATSSAEMEPADSATSKLSPTPSEPATSDPEPPDPSTSSTSPAPRPAVFTPARAMRDIRTLAKDIGPREATSAAFYRAAALVQRRFQELGYATSRQPVRAPAGLSWGVPVDAGRSVNVVADPAGFDPDAPHLVVGAHLDAVPQAPGAEDNASGVAAVLELARLATRAETRLPVRFVAFGAEEPRGEGEAWHHFGSKRYVDLLDRSGREALRGMVSLDRVGVSAPAVPVCTGGTGSTAAQRSVLRAARGVGVSAEACVNTGSDHYSFELKGMSAARVGGVSYGAYHSEADLPKVVNPDQLDRVGRIVWAWLTAR